MGKRWGLIGGILLVYGVVYADGCRRPLQEIGLNPRQIAAIAKSRGYQSTQFYRGTVNGEPKTVVVIGETHIQSKPEAASGRELVDAFPDRSVEGWPGGPLWKGTIRLAYFLEGLAQGKLSGSSISYAARRAGEPGVDHRRLERDYSPSWLERAYSWLVPSVFIGDRLWWTPSLGVFLNFDINNPAYSAIGPVTSLAALIAGTLTKEGIMEKASSVMAPGRDAHMANSVIKRLEEPGSPPVLMVLVGRDHMYGLREHFQSAGFSEIFPPHSD